MERKKGTLKLILVYICFTFTITIGNAQDINDKSKLRLESMHAKLNKPKEYSLYKNNLSSDWCEDGKMASGPLYTLIKRDKSVLIAVNAYKQSRKELKKISRFINNFSDEINYINNFRDKADWRNHNVMFLAKNYLKEHFNADEGVMFTRDCKNIYEDKYPYNSQVMLMKIGQGFFHLTYLYNEEAKTAIEEEVKKTSSQIIWFNDPPVISDQKEHEDLEFTLGQLKATFQTPEGFTADEGNQLETLWCSNDDTKNIIKTLSNPDGSIVIGISLFPPKEAIKYFKALRTANYKEKTSFQKSYITKQGARIYKPNYLHSNFNADAGVKFTLTCNSNKNTTENKYPYGKAVRVMKTDRGAFQINYFYTEQAKDIIDNEIERTLPSIIRFKAF